jgi:hypothetical protein
MALNEVPVNDLVAPSTPGANSLVYVYSISECPPVAITLLGNSNPSVLNASVAGMALYLKSLGPIGTTNLTLRATNLDGNTVNFVLPITIDDVSGPGVSLTKIRGARPLGSLIVKGRATDNVELGRWRYRVNRGKWINGGVLSGTSAVITKKMKGFRNGKKRHRDRGLRQKRQHFGDPEADLHARVRRVAPHDRKCRANHSRVFSHIAGERTWPTPGSMKDSNCPDAPAAA